MGETIAELARSGFRAFKIGWGPLGRVNTATDEAIVAAARQAAGSESMLMVDAGGSDAEWPHGYKWALHTAEMLSDYDVNWFEEPLRPDDIEDFIALRRQVEVPIAGCEVLTRRQSFLPWLQRGAIDVVQPDSTKVGGLSEARRIGWLADAYGVRLVPHGWNTAVGLAADLQLASALPGTDMVEYLTGSAYVDELLSEPFAGRRGNAGGPGRSGSRCRARPRGPLASTRTCRPYGAVHRERRSFVSRWRASDSSSKKGAGLAFPQLKRRGKVTNENAL